MDPSPRPTRRPTGSGAPQQVRLALSLTGGASLGAFQAGAVAALLVAVTRLQQRDAAAGRAPSVRVDAIGVTSAGALVGLLAARCLLDGLDPVQVLHASWVRGASWRELRPRDARAPLSLGRVERSLRELLDARDGDRPVHRLGQDARQPVPLLLHVVTGSLQGVARPVPRRRGRPLAAMTHIADDRFVLRPGQGVGAYVEPEGGSPLDLVLAALSHPAVFPPRRVERPGSNAGPGWRTDGAALLDAPLGRSLAAARRAEELDDAGPGRRVHVLVHPHTAGPARDDRWTTADEQPGWIRTLGRLVGCLDPEPIYHDMRRIEEINDRLRRARALLDAVGPHLPDAAGPALAATLEDGAPPGGEVGELFAATLAEVAGLTGKREVESEVVSPLALLDGDVEAQGRVPEVLAGDGAGRFAGFLDPARRHEDFITGWRSTRAWLPGALGRHGLDADAVRESTAAVDGRVLPPAPRRLPWPGARARFRLVRAAARAARVAADDAVRGR